MRRKRGNRYTREEVLAAIEGSRGCVKYVARKLGCDWRTARKYIDRWTEVQQALEDERQVLLDDAEIALFQALDNGDVNVAKWILAKLGKHRGWGDDVTISGGNIRVVVKWADDEDDEQ